MSALKYWLWLTELRGLSNQTRLALLRRFDTPEAVFYADSGELLLMDGLTRGEIALLEQRNLSRAERILADCCRLGIQIVTLRDASYPGRLKNIYDPPCVLYAKGLMPAFDEEAAVAVVGTRNATPYGLTCAERLGYGLTHCGAVVISGLAKGIDAAATRGALRAGGTTVGVVGNGLDVPYPRESQYLYEDVAAAGVLLSEYPPGTEPARAHFPARNRILSGLSLATLVVEAPEKSGALITAETAMEQGRDVFAVPGPIDAPTSVGCNRLIRDGAGLAAEPWDILREYEARFPCRLHRAEAHRAPQVLGYQAREKERPKAELPVLGRERLTDDQITLLQILSDEEPIAVDDLIQQTGIPIRRVLSALTVLELDQSVAQDSGKRYTRTVTLGK